MSKYGLKLRILLISVVLIMALFLGSGQVFAAESYKLVERNGSYYLVDGENGEVMVSANGLHPASNGKYYYIKNGKWVKYTGIVKKCDESGWFLSKGGLYDPSYTGLAKSSINENYYYVVKGKIRDYTYTGIVKKIDESGWFLAKNGKYYTGFTGLAKSSINSNYYYVVNGKIKDYTYTGIVKKIDESGWFFARNGKYDPNFTGLAKSSINGKYYYVKKGKIQDYSFNGVAQNVDDGANYYVKNGVMNKGYSGMVKSGSTNYYVINGKVPHEQKEKSVSGGSTFVLVSLSKQHLWYYKNGTLLLSTPIVTGSASTPTPTGTFYVTDKSRNARLIGPTWDEIATCWLGIDRSGYYGIHDLPWRKEFGGDVYKRKGSHGCVTLPTSAIPILYNNAPVGTVVYINR